MNELEASLIAARGRNQAARARFQQRLGTVKEELTEHSLPEILGNAALAQTRGLFGHAPGFVSAVAPALLGTAGLAGMWYLRRPLLNWGRAALTTAATRIARKELPVLLAGVKDQTLRLSSLLRR